MYSVIIPLFNKNYSVIRCVESVLQQTYQDFEIIIVNDGSTDNSLDLVQNHFQAEIKSGKIRVYSQKNQGVSAARNFGAMQAHANFICFIDADDEWLPNFLATIDSLRIKCQEAAILSTGHYVRLANQTLKIKRRGVKQGHFGYVDDFFIASTKSPIVNSSKVCIKKEAFQQAGGFPVHAVLGEDLFLWIQIALNDKVATSAEPLAIINQMVDSSRKNRRNKVPYPILHYSKNKVPNIKSLKSYIFMIAYKHFINACLSLRFNEASNILLTFCKYQYKSWLDE